MNSTPCFTDSDANRLGDDGVVDVPPHYQSIKYRSPIEIGAHLWLERRWHEAKTKLDWRELNRILHGAGMAACDYSMETAHDYWLLAELAAMISIETTLEPSDD